MLKIPLRLMIYVNVFRLLTLKFICCFCKEGMKLLICECEIPFRRTQTYFLEWANELNVIRIEAIHFSINNGNVHNWEIIICLERGFL